MKASTVAEIIEKLQTFPQDKTIEVLIADSYFDFEIDAESFTYNPESGHIFLVQG
jgi:hypothetical protein